MLQGRQQQEQPAALMCRALALWGQQALVQLLLQDLHGAAKAAPTAAAVEQWVLGGPLPVLPHDRQQAVLLLAAVEGWGHLLEGLVVNLHQGSGQCLDVCCNALTSTSQMQSE